MLVPLSSFANIYAIVSTAAFDAVYTPKFGFNESTNDVDSTMILPPPPLFTLFDASLQHKNVPLVLTLNIQNNTMLIIERLKIIYV